MNQTIFWVVILVIALITLSLFEWITDRDHAVETMITSVGLTAMVIIVGLIGRSIFLPTIRKCRKEKFTDSVMILHEDGKSSKEIAEILDLEASVVADILEDPDDDVIALYEDGKSITEIAKSLDLDISEVTEILVDNDVI